MTVAPQPQTARAATVAPVVQATPPADAQVGIAQSLVRRYLEAVAHGDDTTARSALGGSGRIVEQQFLDPTMRVTSIGGTRNASGGTRVQVELNTARGQYFATYTIDSTGTVITDHAIIPVGGTTAR